MAVLVYFRHHQRYEEEFDSLEEALNYAMEGEAYESLAAEEVRDGDRVIPNSELRDMLWEREKKAYKLS